MTEIDLHYLISRLNSVSGRLLNHSCGTKTLTQTDADAEMEKLGEVVDRIRSLYEKETKA